MTKHCETRRKIRAITRKKEFNDLLDKCILTEGETALMRMHYSDMIYRPYTPNRSIWSTCMKIK